MRLLPELLDLSIIGSRTVLKSPTIMTGQLERWKKDGSSVFDFGPYCLPIVIGLLLIDDNESSFGVCNNGVMNKFDFFTY